ncbi:hypothetical protein CSH63_32230 [Micromonospora tulbaghiae]|uniref:Uncharacterized protein n=1 Tax=Micromonospora tulbaghiae TaxID=479978 RepID=A0A386X072_9ACTN|nr:hypothetical protein [Micromonospora tulbaghiae]AYF32024.1 hypothetical protein CSH63_32230 [Micromonospora tulbaghiae]
MTTSEQPTGPTPDEYRNAGQHRYPPREPGPAHAKHSKKVPLIIGAAVLIALLCCGGFVVYMASPDTTDTGGKFEPAPPAATSTGRTPAPATTTDAAPTYGQPKPADFKLTVKQLDKQCFGSAGCNLEFRISEVAYSGPDLDPSATYEISYAYKGLSDPMTGTFEMAGDGSYSVDKTEYGQTSSSSKKVTAVVTEVEKM